MQKAHRARSKGDRYRIAEIDLRYYKKYMNMHKNKTYLSFQRQYSRLVYVPLFSRINLQFLSSRLLLLFPDNYVVKQGTNVMGSAENKITITLSRGDLGAIYECQASSLALKEPLKVDVAVKVHGKYNSISAVGEVKILRKEGNMLYENWTMLEKGQGTQRIAIGVYSLSGYQFTLIP